MHQTATILLHPLAYRISVFITFFISLHLPERYLYWDRLYRVGIRHIGVQFTSRASYLTRSIRLTGKGTLLCVRRELLAVVCRIKNRTGQ